MKHTTIIFDLFGTLVDRLSERENAIIRKKVASVLSIPLEDFNRLWSESLYERSVGIFSTVRENIEYIGGALNVTFDESQLTLAAKLRYDLIERAMAPRADALGVVSSLKKQGCRIGLISNCTPDVPKIWEDSPLAPLFDVSIFSCSAGFEKPDPRIYLLALDRLAGDPEECLYVDDNLGSLNGAVQLGMDGVLIRAEDAPEPDSYPESLANWKGPVVSSLTEVLELIE